MFKSIFSKYLATFTVILVCCIVAILLAVSSRISHESYTIQRDSMNSAAGSTAIVLDTYLDENGYDSLYSVFDDDNQIQYVLQYFADNARAKIFVFDNEGMLAASSESDYSVGDTYLTKSACQTMNNDPDSFYISTVDGFFDTNHFNCYRVINAENKSVYVLVSVSNYTGLIFNRDIVIVTITVALWVFLAAMLSLYVISRRTTEPLGQIISAAKSYSRGRFDQKIEVAGQDEVTELAQAINNMAESLEKIDEERNAFIGNVSHDLRTPMTTISGFVDGILDGTIPPEKHEYYLNIISQEVRRLSRLVNTLLEVSRLESGAGLKPVDFNLTETARTVLISLESKISNKNIDIEFNTDEDDIFVNADKDSIHRVIFNLMDNAVKFTPVNGRISINVSVIIDSYKERKALFAIRNTGEGIPREELSHIFDRFYKTDRSRGLDKSGTGLGLYIAKTSIMNHGEDLVADSVVNDYTEFRFTLPMAVVEPVPRRLV